jgi:lipid II:glycine glycyltransferase (peptidoglycan interpeptide bridge formation enzyme)
MPEASLAEWNQFLADNSQAHLLQTGEWGELKSEFGWEAIRLICGKVGAQILFRKIPLGLTVGYLPKFTPDDQPPDIRNGFWQEVDSVCLKKRAVFLKIELDQWETDGLSMQYKPKSMDHSALFSMVENNFEVRISSYNIQPPRTIIVDLRGSEEKILGHMKQKCRYNIRLAEKKGVKVKPWGDLQGFHELMQVTGKRDGFHTHSQEYYRRAYELFHPSKKCELFAAEYDAKPLAALMVFAYGKRAWYVYGASNDEERSRMPTYLLQWEAMRWARAQGCEKYDLWGVPDESELTLEANFEARQDGLWGVYRFKRGFGGELIRAEQAFDRIYNPWLYRIYLWRMAGRERE